MTRHCCCRTYEGLSHRWHVHLKQHQLVSAKQSRTGFALHWGAFVIWVCMQNVRIARDADELRNTRLVKDLLGGERLPAVETLNVRRRSNTAYC
jgi:hypothetical protein